MPNKGFERIFILNSPYVQRLYPELAVEIGLNESIVLLQLEYWIGISENIRDGKKWTYQSVREMQEKAFPFWSVSTINRTINKLILEGYLIEGNYNKYKYDKTRWFSINFNKISELKSLSINIYKRELTENKTHSNQNDTHSNQNDTPSNQNDTGSSQNDTRSNQNVTTIPKTTTKTTTKITKERDTDSKAVNSHPNKNLPVKPKVIVDSFIDSKDLNINNNSNNKDKRSKSNTDTFYNDSFYDSFINSINTNDSNTDTNANGRSYTFYSPFESFDSEETHEKKGKDISYVFTRMFRALYARKYGVKYLNTTKNQVHIEANIFKSILKNNDNISEKELQTMLTYLFDNWDKKFKSDKYPKPHIGLFKAPVFIQKLYEGCLQENKIEDESKPKSVEQHPSQETPFNRKYSLEDIENGKITFPIRFDTGKLDIEKSYKFSHFLLSDFINKCVSYKMFKKRYNMKNLTPDPLYVINEEDYRAYIDYLEEIRATDKYRHDITIGNIEKYVFDE